MSHLLSPEGVRALQVALCGTYTLPINDGEAVLVFTWLPGRAVVAATRRNGVLCVVIDVDKPLAVPHARALLDEWRAEFVGAAGIPEPRRESCPLSLAS